MKIFNTISKRRDNSRGFSLVEMMVSVSIFIIVMVVAAGAVLSIVDANRKSQSAKVAIDNLSFALESMSRHIRVGNSYASPDGVSFSFYYKDPLADVNVPSYQIWYTRQVINGVGRLMISGKNTPAVFYTFSSPDIDIESLNFYVTGAGALTGQPHVRIVMKGTAGGPNEKQKTTFNLQTSITQRVLDSQ